MPLKKKRGGSGWTGIVSLESALNLACSSKQTLRRDESQQMFSGVRAI